MSLDARDSLAVPRSTAQAVVTKSEDIFFLSEKDASVPSGNDNGFGLYFHDCRYLDKYQLLIGDNPPNSLLSTCDRGAIAEFELTNGPYELPDGSKVDEQTLGIRLRRVIDSDQSAVHDLITITNYDVRERDVPLSLSFRSSFDDIFMIRGICGKTKGKKRRPAWHGNVLTLSYVGEDGINRRLEVHAEPEPRRHTSETLKYYFTLAAGATQELRLSLRIREGRDLGDHLTHDAADQGPVTRSIDRRIRDRMERYTQFHSDNDLLNEVMRRSLLDIGTLRSEFDECQYTSAGLPWYGALFGRDSIIAALQTLAFEPSIAEQTIRLLAKHQGEKSNHWCDEEPGKILHELRRGELANLNAIPQTPYFGAVDSTALFLILVGEHSRWTGTTTVFEQLRSNVERALYWIDSYADLAQDGYVSYSSKSSKGLGNQGWKDSGDAIANADGSLATPPIALVEVQGYTYLAKTLIAELYSQTGDAESAARLAKQAADLKERFNADFWIDDKQFFALALQKHKRRAAVISSNPGQALWSGIVDESKAKSVVQRLMAEDMFSGWGVRTLSTGEKRANPIGYHLGTVWPHDNSIIAAGMKRYGFERESIKVCDGILAAAQYFQHYRLPEVFSGYSREELSLPVRYPVACHPQAWAAGSVPFMLANLLGIVPDALHGRLLIDNPVLPNGTSHVQLRRMKIGKSEVDLDFRRRGERVEVTVIRDNANVEVKLERAPGRLAA